MKGLDTCIQHTKKVKFYCEDHNKLCCSGCVTTHRKCDKFSELSALSKAKEAYREVLNALLEIKEDSISLKQDTGQLEVELNERVANLSSEIDKVKSKLLIELDNDKSLFLLKSESIGAEMKLLIEQRKEELDIIETDISLGLQLLSRTLKKGTPSQLFIVGRAVSETLRNAQYVIQCQKQLPLSITMHLGFSNELTQVLKSEINNIILHTDESCECKVLGPGSFRDIEGRWGLNSRGFRGRCSYHGVGRFSSRCWDRGAYRSRYYRFASALMSTNLRHNNPNIADLSDQFRPTKLAEMFSELYDNEWTDAFHELSVHFSDDQLVIDFLLNITLLAYEFCSQEMEMVLEMACKWYMVETKEAVKEFKDIMKISVQKNVNEIRQKFLKRLETVYIEDKKKACLTGRDTSAYITQCVRLSLHMCACDPPLVMACPGRQPVRETLAEDLTVDGQGPPGVRKRDQKKTSDNVPASVTESVAEHRSDVRLKEIRVVVEKVPVYFDKEMYKEYTAQGSMVDFFVWPALYLNSEGPLLSKGIDQGKTTQIFL